jgi:molecular chaperone GrpE
MKKSKATAEPEVKPTPEAKTPPPDDAPAPETQTGASDAADELAALTAKAQENWDRMLRVTAEFENFRKRAAREKEEAVRYANQGLMERLLPALDSFDMALNAANSHDGDSSKALEDGIRLVSQQLKSILKETGLEEIEAEGQPFDPNLHEAVSQIETEEVEEGHVAQQIRKGYRLRDRLVRPSSVIVAKKPAA